MNASRELDALIAVRVFGWTGVREHQMWSLGENGESEPDGTQWMGQPPLRTHPEMHSWLPRYSTDIAAAFAIVSHMHAQLFAYGCAPAGEVPEPWPNANYLTLSCLSGSDEWSATFCCILGDEANDWYEHPEEAGGAKAHGAPLAICLAALSAVGASLV